jgi:RNA 2',3'-cyclic 3'-phosphodiesterase
VEVGSTVERAALALVDRLRARVVRVAPRARVTWVRDGRIHVTLAFIGEVDDARAGRVAATLRRPLPGPAFEASVEGLGVFPPRGAPRVLWVGIGAGRERLLELEREVRARLAAVELALEDRPYHPHVTLARIREPAGLRAATLLDVEGTELGPARVGAITLFQSRLSPRGPEYVALQRTALGGAAGAEEPAADV